jgi:hypothetical protein
MTGPGPTSERWLDKAAGPVVRPYALVGGRTTPAGGHFDLIAMVTTSRRAAMVTGDLEPGHLQVLDWCRIPRSVADLAAELSLPVGVLSVILGDLREQGLVIIQHPDRRARPADPQILRRIADGLRRL